MLLIKQRGRLLLLVVQQKYKKVHTKSISTGFGLTGEDQNVGISTINEKLESMCPQYHAMNELMTLMEWLIEIDGNNTGKKHETHLNGLYFRAGHKGAFSNTCRKIRYVCSTQIYSRIGSSNFVVTS
ncbi:hypothetical protein VP01_2372g1 [Puccinia sorghi]|uniref:Uncharacterized protein n=1 Tax=Puccinia sorghi TaxID=27349 RepID=A0A0L6V8Y4_9BASI|nr:hypothetical protein VP01_2372g1 [Puccinia sorghi]